MRMMRSGGRPCAALALLPLLLCGAPAAAAAPQPASAWLFVSDIHLDPAARSPRPARLGRDTNAALLRSTVAEMRRLSPRPPVVVIAGDFLGHHIAPKLATPTMVALARTFDRAFPAAQFVITLGNNDSSCGDYRFAADSAFLRDVGRAWAPLVNRHGAAPAFARTFAHDGFYTADLPGGRVRAVVPDDIPWSPRYRACPGAGATSRESVDELGRALRAPGTRRNWIVLHIPPGVDAYATVHYGHRLVVVPLLDSAPRQALEAFAADPANRVALAVAGHTHRFSYRLLGAGSRAPVPVLIVPAVSPIYDNAPSFLTADVAADGTVGRVREHSYVDGAWQDDGGLASLGVPVVSARALLGLQQRLAAQPALRDVFGRLYTGDGYREVTPRNWRAFWCAATELGVTPFRACMGEGGFSIFTGRGLALAAAAAAALVVLLAVAALVLVRATRTQPRPRP